MGETLALPPRSDTLIRFLSIILVVIVILHGLIHLLGFAAYWPLADIPNLPYKTSLLGGRLEVGASGMRIFSLLWLLVALGFVLAAGALALGKSYWAPLLLGTTLLSLAICILDWKVAYLGALIDVFLLLVLGVVFSLLFQPTSLPAYAAPSGRIQTVPLPAGLPEPVERFYRQVYGDEIPVYHSTVISGRGTIRFMGITFPGRLRFTHDAGQAYRHYLEATFYALPLLKVNEHYLDGHARLALPFGVVENDPGVDSAANQGLWGETFMFPAVFLTDRRVRWEAIDNTTARVYIPFREDEQVFTVEFDTQTGLITHMETIRYRDEKVGKIRWWGEIAWGSGPDGRPAPQSIAVTWEDEGTPWLVAKIEDIQFNSDVSTYIRQTGL